MTAARPEPTLSLGGAYTVERELGGGGMSRVFLATDPALGRRVVVKVLAPELVQGFSAERFAREIRLAAALQDPHIVPVLTAGTTTDGLPYYTMPFVEGESLRARLMRREPGSGPVPFGESIGVLRDVARALEYAHAHGVVHRDIKPENVLLAGRTAVVADFGIAKAVSAARTLSSAQPNGTALTSIGQSIGTPAYMAPEQVAGDATDHRADLYAWGMLAYELLAGRHPFADKVSGAQLMTAQLAEVPASLGERVPGLPLPLAALVMHCLAKDPDDRPASATAVLEALESSVTPSAGPSGASLGTSSRASSGATARAAAKPRRRVALLVAAVVAVVALGTGSVAAWRASSRHAAASDRPALAVLPFEHQGDSADAYLTDGITDEIRGKLTGVHDLVVIARGSSNQYRGSKKSPREIAEELGVRYLLTGTVRVVGTNEQRRVLVRPELVEITPAGQPQSRWGQPFDASAADVIRVQGAIAEQVVGAMEVALGGADSARLVQVTTRDPIAYDLYLRGMAAIGGGTAADPVSLRTASALFEQAVARDPTMVDAWTALTRSLSLLYHNGVPSPTVARRARAAADRVAALAPDGAARYLALGTYLKNVAGDPIGAVDAYLRARRLDASDAVALRGLAGAENELGRFDDALRDYDAAVRLDPLYAAGHVSRAQVLIRMRRLAEARAAIARGRALAPAALPPTVLAMNVELAAGDLAAAQRVVADAMSDVPRDRLLTTVTEPWALRDGDQRHLLDLDVSAYGGDREALATTRAQLYWWRGDSARARAWSDSAVAVLQEEMRATPSDVEGRALLGLMLAQAGRSQAALATAAQGIALIASRPDLTMKPTSALAFYMSARAAVIAGDRDRALTWLRGALERRHMATPAWVRLDPSWAPLQSDPRFERLLAEFSR